MFLNREVITYKEKSREGGPKPWKLEFHKSWILEFVTNLEVPKRGSNNISLVLLKIGDIIVHVFLGM